MMYDCDINVNKQVQESLKNINLQLILIPHIGTHSVTIEQSSNLKKNRFIKQKNRL